MPAVGGFPAYGATGKASIIDRKASQTTNDWARTPILGWHLACGRPLRCFYEDGVKDPQVPTATLGCGYVLNPKTCSARASPCKYHAPNPNPDHMNGYISMWSIQLVVLSRIKTARLMVIEMSSFLPPHSAILVSFFSVHSLHIKGAD